MATAKSPGVPERYLRFVKSPRHEAPPILTDEPARSVGGVKPSVLLIVAAVVIAVGFLRIYANSAEGPDLFAGLGVVIVGSALLVCDAVDRLGRRPR